MGQELAGGTLISSPGNLPQKPLPEASPDPSERRGVQKEERIKRVKKSLVIATFIIYKTNYNSL
ncbi:hypothetical protein JCM17724A_01920 [Prevotella fusca JCM 17724]